MHDLHQHLISIEAKLDNLRQDLRALSRKVDKIMALADDLKAGLTKVEEETTLMGANIAKVGTVLDDLRGRIKNTLTDAEVAEITDRLGTASGLLHGEADQLDAMAKDPANPVPPTPPQLASLRKRLK